MWVDHLTHIDNEIERARQLLEATRSDLTAVLEKIVDLKAKDGPSEDLTRNPNASTCADGANGKSSPCWMLANVCKNLSPCGNCSPT